MGSVKWTMLWQKYRYVALVILAGVVLMLLPTGGKKTRESDAVPSAGAYFSLEETERRMEAVLGQMEGVGKLRIMLTVRSGPELKLAEDVDRSDGAEGSERSRSRREIVTVNRGSGSQEVVVTQQIQPVYQGAVVVCQGAGNAGVRLAVTEAVAALTGLSTDKISVVQWNQA